MVVYGSTQHASPHASPHVQYAVWYIAGVVHCRCGTLQVWYIAGVVVIIA